MRVVRCAALRCAVLCCAVLCCAVLCACSTFEILNTQITHCQQPTQTKLCVLSIGNFLHRTGSCLGNSMKGCDCVDGT